MADKNHIQLSSKEEDVLIDFLELLLELDKAQEDECPKKPL